MISTGEGGAGGSVKEAVGCLLKPGSRQTLCRVGNVQEAVGLKPAPFRRAWTWGTAGPRISWSPTHVNQFGFLLLMHFTFGDLISTKEARGKC